MLDDEDRRPEVLRGAPQPVAERDVLVVRQTGCGLIEQQQLRAGSEVRSDLHESACSDVHHTEGSGCLGTPEEGQCIIDRQCVGSASGDEAHVSADGHGGRHAILLERTTQAGAGPLVRR